MFVFILFLFLAFNQGYSQVIQDDPAELQGIDVIEHLGDSIPLDLRFINHSGDTVALEQYFHKGTPIILAFHYSDCPMLCSLVLNGISNSVRQLSFQAGIDFQILTASINPRETIERSAQTHRRYAQTLKPGTSPNAWTFFTGDEPSIQALADAVGFKYYYVEERSEYAHPAVIFILSEEGVISRYLYGVEFQERNLRLALLEASEGKIGSSLDRIILYCFHYDPAARGYVAMAGNIMKLGGILTVGVLLFFLAGLWIREKVRR